MDKYNRPPRHHKPGGRSGGHGGSKPPAIAVQEPFLNTLRRENVQAVFTLIGGQEVQGLIDSFDQTSILIRKDEDDESGLQLLYKHSIAEVHPQQKIIRTQYGISLHGKPSTRRRQDPEESYNDDDDWEM